MEKIVDRISMRDTYGKALVKLGETFENVVALTADAGNSDRSMYFEQRFPVRYFNMGIAEQSLVDTAVGMSYSGFVPFVNAFAVFLATRALEMIRTHACYGRAPIKLMGAYAGLSDSFDGPTHHSITDIAIMRSLPYMSVVIPGDPREMEAVLKAVYEWKGPVFCRLNRNEVPLIYKDEIPEFKIGKARQLREGSDATIIANGMLLSRSLQAADQLQLKGLSVRVVEMHTVKPLDIDTVKRAAKETGAIVTAEEHSIIGGLGAAVCETVSSSQPVPVIRVGINDQFAETGPYERLLDAYGMSVEDICAAVKTAVKLK